MGSYSLDDAKTQVVAILRDYGAEADEQEVTDTEVVRFLRQAAAAYSGNRPLEVVADVTADGTALTALPEGFDPDAGVVLRVELEDTAGDWAAWDDRLWHIYRSPTGVALRWLPGCAIAAGTTVRIACTTPRAWGVAAADTTIVDVDFYAVCDLAVSIACSAIAQKYARTHEPIVNAAVVGYRTKAQEWDGRAKAYREAYERALRLTGGVAPSGGRVNWDSRGSSADWLTHGRWTR